MLRFTERLIDEGFSQRLVRESDVAMIFKGTPASRYGLVNKALKKGELIRLCRGVYVLAEKYRTIRLSKFHIAGQIVRLSFVTFESSLAYHGWIPERVETIESAISLGRSRGFETPFGYFQYTRLPTDPFHFLTGVVQRGDETQTFLVAKPLRALVDLAYRSRQTDFTLRYVTEALRIDTNRLEQLTIEDFSSVAKVYKFTHVKRFLASLQKELALS